MNSASQVEYVYIDSENLYIAAPMALGANISRVSKEKELWPISI